MSEAFREAVAAIDAGDVATLERLLETNPSLVHERAAEPTEGYFSHPYLLWFVAENPIRNGKLPKNIVTVTRTLLAANPDRAQLDYTLSLVASGRVPRECGVQLALMNVLMNAGANPSAALVAALAHREVDAAELLLDRGARLTRPDALQVALFVAAGLGDAAALRDLIALGADIHAYGPRDVHPHSTALHQAVDSGSLAAVKVLVEHGANLEAADRLFEGTPLDWAEHMGNKAIARYLRARTATPSWRARHGAAPPTP